MKRLLKSKLVLTIAALVMIVAAVAIPLAGSRSTLSSVHAAKPSISWPHDALSSGPLLAEAIRSGSVHVGSLSTKLPNVGTTLTCSHAPCVLPNTQASGGNPPGTGPVDETPIVASPINGSNLLTGGNDYNCPTLQGFYATSNKGLTWKSTCMLPLPGDCGLGDPGVGYDLKGVAYIVGLDASAANCGPAGLNAIAIEHSTNNGTTWSAPTLVVAPVLPGGTIDKEWLQVDDDPASPHANALYVSATQFGPGGTSTISVSHSTNGGATWTTTVVDAVQTSPQVDQFSDVAISDEGIVYVSWMRCSATGPTGNCSSSTATFYVSKSTNGGVTWSTPSPIATVTLAPDTATCTAFYGCIPNTNERVSDIPAIGTEHADIDSPGTFDNLYAVFYNWTGTFMQVEVPTSTNGGKTWSKPVHVAPATDMHDQFFPWLSVNEDGIVGVTWLDRRNDPANVSYEAFAAVSTNGGLSFSTNVQIATTPSNPNNDGFGGTFMGDYTGNSWFNETLYASWMDSRNGVNMQDEVGGYRLG